MKITSLSLAIVFACATAPILNGQVVPSNIIKRELALGASADAQIIQIDAKNGKSGDKKSLRSTSKQNLTPMKSKRAPR